MLSSLRNWLSGKKTYLLAVAGLLAALIAWADGSLDTMAMLAALWAAGQTVFIRLGVDKAAK